MQKNTLRQFSKAGLKLMALGIQFLSCSYQFETGGVYVSSVEGDDANSGKDNTTPLKTIEAALAKSDTIFLKRGEIFYTKDIVLNGKYCSSYGKGEHPIICGYKRIVQPNWEKVEGKIWRLNLTDDNFTGGVVHGSDLSNNIGCLHEYDKDSIHGHKVRYYLELKENWDLWQTEKVGRKISPKEFDLLYLYYDGNPNNLKLELSSGCAAVLMERSTIDGIDFVGYGFGISAGTESIIRNCRIDAMGGMIQLRDDCFCVFGNGIEFYISKDIENCLVENCKISRCYDCGVTIQASNYKQSSPRNIIVRRNLIDRCCQGWEDFLRNDSNVVYENCVFENNIVTNSGNTSGFGYPSNRFKYCHVLGNNFKGNKGMIIHNNTFVDGNYYCSGAYKGEYKSNIWQGNKCVIKRGDYILGNYMGTKDVIRIPKDKGEFASLSEATDDAIKRYRKLTGDETTKFIIKDEIAIKRQIKKLKKSFNRR